MARFTAIYQNYADTAVLSGGSYLPALPLANVKTLNPGIVARTTDPLAASTKLIADLGASRGVGGIALGPTNISPGAHYRIVASNAADFSAPVYDSGSVAVPGTRMDWSDPAHWLAWEDPGFWFGIPDLFDQELVPVWAMTVFPADKFARFWKIEVTDPLNQDGYMQFGRLMIGRAFRPTYNYGPGGEFNVEPIYQRIQAIGGQRTDWDLGRRRTLRITFTDLPTDDLFGDVARMQQVAGASKQIFVCPDPDDTANFQKRSFLATLKTPPAIVQTRYERGTTVIDAEEVLP